MAQAHQQAPGGHIMELKSVRIRIARDLGMKVMATISSLIGIFFLGWILLEVAARGLSAFSLSFFTHLPAPPGMESGGLANAIIGTLLMTVLATAAGVPIGIMGGVYLAEYGQTTLLGKSVRFTLNVIMGVPSIIIGLFIYTLIVLPLGHFTGYAGAFSLAVIMIPIIARVTEDMLNMVPSSLRESALAVGAPHWKMIVQIVFRAAKSGLMTGILLAVARVSGETAPLLFTALNSPYWPTSIGQPTANLTVTIYNYAMSPYQDWQSIAWGASLLIMTSVLVMTVIARYVSRERVQ